MLFCFFCTRQTVSAQRGTNHQKVYNEHLYPKFWVRTKVQVYIYIYMYIIPSCVACLLCVCVCLCVYSAAQFYLVHSTLWRSFFFAFLFSSLALWLLWVCGFCGFTMLCLSIYLSFFLSYLSIYLSNLIYLILSI